MVTLNFSHEILISLLTNRSPDLRFLLYATHIFKYVHPNVLPKSKKEPATNQQGHNTSRVFPPGRLPRCTYLWDGGVSVTGKYTSKEVPITETKADTPRMAGDRSAQVTQSPGGRQSASRGRQGERRPSRTPIPVWMWREGGPQEV